MGRFKLPVRLVLTTTSPLLNSGWSPSPVFLVDDAFGHHVAIVGYSAKHGREVVRLINKVEQRRSKSKKRGGS